MGAGEVAVRVVARGEKNAVEWDITQGKHGIRIPSMENLSNFTYSPAISVPTAV